MSQTITVREYARLTTTPLNASSLDYAQIPVTMFDWLCRLSAGYRTQYSPALAEVEDRLTLQLDNYVGVLQSPCGIVLEILPKTMDVDSSVGQMREILKDMIASFIDTPTRESESASLERFHLPLNEWVIVNFLSSVNTLLKRGIRSDYLRTEQSEPFLRGQLDMARQMRQLPGKEHQFHLRYDVFSPDRAENRLIVRALKQVIQSTQRPGHWRLARELALTLSEIPASRNINNDFNQWQIGRLMAHYQPVKPWCEIVLSSLMPLAVSGEWQGISMLFPMEKLFEKYVESHLRKVIMPDVKLVSQARAESLCQHNNNKFFELRPDILLEKNKNPIWVIDAKWKSLDRNNTDGKYGLHQSDFYQLYAYGQKYMNGTGNMALIYPAHKNFRSPLPPFDFDSKLRMWVLPFEITGVDKGRVIYHTETDLPFIINMNALKKNTQ